MAKRLFDIFFSLAVLLFGAPVFLLCAIAVKGSTPGSVFFADPRLGIGGKPFGCFKFRTMYPDAKRKLEALLAGDPQLLHEWKTHYKLKDDPRITSVGRWLRKTSLDEIPQFFNVLKGDMSLVGPRPLTLYEAEELQEKAAKVISVRPGLTSLWAVSGRSQFTFQERIALEELYIDRRTFWLDLRLIAKTVVQMLFPKGAY